MRWRGLAHVHSTVSYDGRHEPEELVAFGRAAGYHFLAMSEHSETLSAPMLAAYAARCQALTSRDFLVIPGVEFTCEGNFHLLAFGMVEYTDESDPVRVSRAIRRAGAVAVLAHPVRYDYRMEASLVAELDGIEVWNAGYDGRFVPNPTTAARLKALRGQRSSLLAFAGQDLHLLTDARQVWLEVEAPFLTREAVLGALKQGAFVASNGLVSVTAMQEDGLVGRLTVGVAGYAYRVLRWARDLAASGAAPRLANRRNRG